jgi:hypothetical protein
MVGSGAGAYRLVAWQSGSDYDSTAAFYTGLDDARWKSSGSSATTLQSTEVSFTDSSGVFAKVDVDVTRTDPVKIAVRFLSKTAIPVQSFGPGPTIVFGALPTYTSLPDGFPSALVPQGGSVVDASSVGSTYFVVLSMTTSLAAYETQIGSLVQITDTITQGGVTISEFTYNGHPGQLIFDPSTNRLSIQVTT